MTVTQRPEEDRLDRLERIVAEAVTGLTEVRDIQAKAAATQAEAAAAHKAEMAEIRSIVADTGKRLDQLTEQQQRNNQDLSVIKGWQTELVVERNAREIFSRLSPRGSLMRIYPKDELAHYVSRGARHDFITASEGEDAAAIDFLMEGTDHSGAPVIFAVEVSYAAGFSDIERAVKRAPLLTKILGREAVRPAVAAEIITEAFEEDARTYKVSWAYVPNGNRIMQ